MLFKKLRENILLLTLMLIIITSCSTTRKVPEGKFLLKKNSIIINNNNIGREDIAGLIKQKPNKKLFGVKFKLLFYNLSRTNNPKAFSRFLIKIGEPPVILDTLKIKHGLEQISLYLSNHGYFNPILESNVKYSDKKAKVTYKINVDEPYRINKIEYAVEDKELVNTILARTGNSIIKEGDIFNTDKFEKERERITTYLKNSGYFAFNKDFVVYTVDSFLNSKKMNVRLIVKSPKLKVVDGDTIVYPKHLQYKISKIFIFPDFNPAVTDTLKKDTLFYFTPQFENRNILNKYYFIHRNKMRIRPQTISQSVFINTNSFFNLTDVEQTYNRLSELKNFRFISINFDESEKGVEDTLPNCKGLICNIELSKNKVNSYSTEIEASNSSGYFGITGNILFQNRNFFRGAEIFNLRLKGVLDNQKINIYTSDKDRPLFNTYETGVEIGLEIPKFLVPIAEERFNKYFKPRTIISTGYHYQNRPDFIRTITMASFGYEWKQKNIQHFLNPIEVNAVKIYPDSSIKASIEAIADKRLKYQYTDHFILNLKYTFVYNTQELNRRKNFTFFRANVETAGNFLYLTKKLFDDKRNAEGDYEVFNLIYSQYARIEIELRRYIFFNRTNNLVLRANGGWGIPYGNSKQLPYEKSFISGGTNDIRAWRLRTLGPGSYYDTIVENFDRVGDISIKFNVEHRFQIYKFLHGAFFADAGNIWLNKPNAQFPEGDFVFNKLLQQIAIGAGFGFRIDLNFFIIRVDAAIPVKDPTKPKNNQWVISDTKLRSVVFNFGIGYPF